MKTNLIAVVLAVPGVALANDSDCLDMANDLARGQEVVEFCESCGDDVPGLPYIAGDLTDPMHTYVRTRPDRFENLALLTGCASSIEPPSLDQEIATADGILIVPSRAPVTPLVAARDEPPPERPHALAVLPTPPPIQYMTTIMYSVPWLAIAALAGGLGFGLGIAATLLVLALRRRRAMEPRAAALA